MGVKHCLALSNRAILGLLSQVNKRQFGEMNEATLQHHLALNIHLNTIGKGKPDIEMTLEKKVQRTHGFFS